MMMHHPLNIKQFTIFCRNPSARVEPVLSFSDSEFLFEGQKASVDDLRMELLREGYNCTALHSTTLRCTALRCTIRDTALDCTGYYNALFSNAMYSATLYCTKLRCHASEFFILDSQCHNNINYKFRTSYFANDHPTHALS